MRKSRRGGTGKGRGRMVHCGVKEVFEDEKVVRMKVKKLAQIVRTSKYTVVYTGAGISTAAGIPDFRGPSGVWTLRARGEQVSEPDFLKMKPTLTHWAVKTLLDKGFAHHVVSQNIDGLHRRSGLAADQISEIHGNAALETCINCGASYLRPFMVWGGLCSDSTLSSAAAAGALQATWTPTRRRGRAKGGRKQRQRSVVSSTVNDLNDNRFGLESVDGTMTGYSDHRTGRLCEQDGCGAELLNSVVMFGEPLPKEALDAAADHTAQADVALVLGSSLRVGPACDFPVQVSNRGGSMIIVNLQHTPLDRKAKLVIHARCDLVMCLLLEELGLPPVSEEFTVTSVPVTRKRSTRVCKCRPSIRALPLEAEDENGNPKEQPRSTTSSGSTPRRHSNLPHNDEEEPVRHQRGSISQNGGSEGQPSSSMSSDPTHGKSSGSFCDNREKEVTVRHWGEFISEPRLSSRSSDDECTVLQSGCRELLPGDLEESQGKLLPVDLSSDGECTLLQSGCREHLPGNLEERQSNLLPMDRVHDGDDLQAGYFTPTSDEYQPGKSDCRRNERWQGNTEVSCRGSQQLRPRESAKRGVQGNTEVSCRGSRLLRPRKSAKRGMYAEMGEDSVHYRDTTSGESDGESAESRDVSCEEETSCRMVDCGNDCSVSRDGYGELEAVCQDVGDEEVGDFRDEGQGQKSASVLFPAVESTEKLRLGEKQMGVAYTSSPNGVLRRSSASVVDGFHLVLAVRRKRSRREDSSGTLAGKR
ncbi:hypothetical protein CBR_g70742 [Chara braunii]|uniref:protein acetyllysine N-acetyltransferase n=1 Tax=Chara braunii TaxID=69332 RepID=A0A388K9Y1_CHABU|nr:hypothetical protein CBR_g70742 [Chara braunii]|eukprot:GBG66865.1 hypothetical protein CBR_g70742 [Chara braunii]